MKFNGKKFEANIAVNLTGGFEVLLCGNIITVNTYLGILLLYHGINHKKYV